VRDINRERANVTAQRACAATLLRMRSPVGVSLLVLGVIASGSAIAAAKPLPKRMKVTLKNERLYIELRGVTVPLQGAERAARDPFSSLDSAELSDDGEHVVVKGQHCAMSDADEGVEISLAIVEARVENALGMQLHTKKKFVDAIPHFAAAMKDDPTALVYATNLLSALAMAKQLDEADKMLATIGPSNAAWFAWRLMVDPELAGLRGRPSTKAVLASRPSALTWKRLGGSVATSPLGLVAASEWNFFGGPGAPFAYDLVIYDLQHSKVMLRLPVVAPEDACGDGPPEMATPCTKRTLAHTAEHTRIANLVLAALGFESQPTVKLESTDGDAYASSDGKITAKVSGDKITLGSKTSAMLPDEGGHTLFALLAGNLFVLTYRENGFLACDGDAQRTYSTFHVLK
jgi:hypothetical protein